MALFNGVSGLCSRMRQPMSSKLTLLAHWSFRQKTKPCQFSSVQIRRSVHAFSFLYWHIPSILVTVDRLHFETLQEPRETHVTGHN